MFVLVPGALPNASQPPPTFVDITSEQWVRSRAHALLGEALSPQTLGEEPEEACGGQTQVASAARRKGLLGGGNTS